MRAGIASSVGALAVGASVGVGLFFLFFEMPAADTLQKTNLYRYNGTVDSIDTAAKTITVLVPESYPFLDEPRRARFTYTDKTLWASFEYLFEDDVVVSRLTRNETPRELPPGTMVTLQADDSGGTYEAEAIVFLRRTNL